MIDLSDRLDELNSITHTFKGDVAFFRERCDLSQPVETSSDASAIHRAYVRAVFALIEALLHQHKSLLLDLADNKIVLLDEKTLDRLRESKRFMGLKEKVKAVCKAASHAFGQKLQVDFSTSGWRMFVKAIDPRDQITHPKSFCECSIQIWDIEAVEQAEGWFQAMHNEFVRLAREHQKITGWKPPGDCESIPLVALDIYAKDAREWRNGADGSFLAATLLFACPDPRL